MKYLSNNKINLMTILLWTNFTVFPFVPSSPSSFRVRLEVNEKQIYENLAQLVRWVDFDSKTEKEKKDEEEKEKSRVLESIKRFQFALEEVVRLVYETQMAPGTGSLTLPMNVQRR